MCYCFGLRGQPEHICVWNSRVSLSLEISLKTPEFSKKISLLIAVVFKHACGRLRLCVVLFKPLFLQTVLNLSTGRGV